MDIPLLPDIVKIFGMSIAVLLFCHRIHLPNVVGFLLIGMICGPHALKLIHDEAEVQILAQLGIVLLLFTVGMEFSFKRIIEYRRYFFIGGLLQVGLTVLATLAISFLCIACHFGRALFFGFLVSLSSTAIVLRVLDEKHETDTPYGRVIVGVMIFQDIVAIPMMLLIPFLGGVEQALDWQLVYTVGKGLAVLGLVLFSAEKLVPMLMHLIARTRSRELFLLTVLTVCFAVAWVTSSVGLSLSLGAFLAGLIISESDYRTEAIGDILPFQDIFTSFFFVSIGMLLDLQFVIQQPLMILCVTGVILGLKALVAGGTAIVLGMPLRAVVLTGIALCQIGEFSLVLAKTGSGYDLASEYQYQLFLAVSLLSMALTPTLMALAPKMADHLLRLPIPVRIKSGLRTTEEAQQQRKDHIVIVGFGISGRNLARSAKEGKIPYVILDMNAEVVKLEKQKGEPIHFGDATHESVLHHVNVAEARVVAVVINDSAAAGRIVEIARHLNPRAYIVVRTRYLREMKQMCSLGADEVIPDEYGSSVEIFTRVLRKYQIPTAEVEKIVADMRVEGYEMLRLLFREPTTLSDLHAALTDVVVESLRIAPDAPLAGRTLSESDLRKDHGVTVMMIKRGLETISRLDGQTRFVTDDIVVVVGAHANIAQASRLFKPLKPPPVLQVSGIV